MKSVAGILDGVLAVLAGGAFVRMPSRASCRIPLGVVTPVRGTGCSR
jgi:hypothetical protein